jgi:uncharacterized tellurite resistance protein B-like protein
MSLSLRTPVAKMTDQQREWFASAMVSMILADGSVTKDEVESLMQAIHFVKNPQAVERLKKFIHFQAPPNLTPFHGWEHEPKSRAMILVDLMSVAIADRNFSEKERDQFHRIGTLLGFPNQRVDELIHMGDQALERIEHDKEV